MIRIPTKWAWFPPNEPSLIPTKWSGFISKDPESTKIIRSRDTDLQNNTIFSKYEKAGQTICTFQSSLVLYSIMYYCRMVNFFSRRYFSENAF